MVKTRSGKQYDTTQMLLEKKVSDIKKEKEKLEKDLQVMEERFNKAKENYVNVLGLLVNRVANHRILTLCIEKMKEDSRDCAGGPCEERECCVCYETSNMNVVCKNGHSMCITCLSKMNWTNRNHTDFMDSTRCPCCRANFVERERDIVFELAGISFGNTQVRIS